MALLSDETLMAYADGELDDAARARVEAVLERDPDSRARLKIFISTGAPLAALYGRPMAEPVPPHLVALVLGGQEKMRSHHAARERRPAKAAGEALKVLFAWPQWAMVAASAVLVLAIGGSGGWYLRQTSSTMNGLVKADRGQFFAVGPLKRALETAPSGADAPLGTVADTGGASSVRLVLTFKNRQNAFCRQYDMTIPQGAYAGIACRNDDGQWRLDLHLAASPRPANRANRTRPAGAGHPADVEAAVSRVIEGDALGRTDEDALLRNKWQP